MKELDRRARLYRGDRPSPDLRGKTVILVDDGLATGATMLAAVKALRQQQAGRIVAAVPIASPETCEQLRGEVDDIICAVTPEPFYAVDAGTRILREVINGLLRKAGAALEDGKQVLELEEPVDLSTMFLDTTCLKTNIHFPVDWVLLRDGVKSLMQSVELIRTHGLKSRMCEPQEFISKINRLSMEMTHTRRKKNAQKSASGCCGR